MPSSKNPNEQASPVQLLGVTHDWITLRIYMWAKIASVLAAIRAVLKEWGQPAREIDPDIPRALRYMRVNGCGTRKAARVCLGDERRHTLLEYYANRPQPPLTEPEQ